MTSRYEQLNDGEWLRIKYRDEKKSGPEIASIVGCGADAVYRALEEHGIETRAGGNEGIFAKDYPELHDEGWLEERYADREWTSRDIADEVGCSSALVLKALERAGIPRRQRTVKHPRLYDPDWLEEQYVENKRSGSDIGEELGCTKHSVYRALKRYDIERRARTSKYEQLNDEGWLKEKYVEQQLSAPQIAEMIGSTTGNVTSALKARGVKRRCTSEALEVRFGPRSGENAPNWQGGRSKLPSGYIYVYAPEHPNATEKGYVMEHRLVMEEHIGRYLESYELVHHIDGDRGNNDIENLEIKLQGEHIADHFDDGYDARKLEAENAKLEAENEKLRQRVAELESQLEKLT